MRTTQPQATSRLQDNLHPFGLYSLAKGCVVQLFEVKPLKRQQTESMKDAYKKMSDIKSNGNETPSPLKSAYKL